jgi:hypothetical protein
LNIELVILSYGSTFILAISIKLVYNIYTLVGIYILIIGKWIIIYRVLRVPQRSYRADPSSVLTINPPIHSTLNVVYIWFILLFMNYDRLSSATWGYNIYYDDIIYYCIDYCVFWICNNFITSTYILIYDGVYTYY